MNIFSDVPTTINQIKNILVQRKLYYRNTPKFVDLLTIGA